MVAIVKRSFSAVVDGQSVSYAEGDMLTLPPGVDWLTAGLVELIVDDSERTATIAPDEQAVTKRRKK